MRNVVIVGLIVLLSACGVSKEQYTSLEEQVRSCENNLKQITDAKTSCEENLGTLSSSKNELEKKTQTYEDLVNSLKGEIEAGKISISEMKNRLTVNLIDKILFESGQTSIQEEGKAALKKIAAILKEVKDKQIQVEGHTDNVKLGPSLQKIFPTNWELSTARATAVVRYLAELGVDEKRLSATGYSMFSPIASNDSPEKRRQNRRIEIVLVPKFEAKTNSK